MPRPLINVDRLARTLSRVPAAIADAAMVKGRVFGVGGDAWTVHVPFGDGLSEPAEPGAQGTWTGYVYRTELGAQRSATGTPVASAEWLAVGAASTYARTGGGTARLNAGMTLTSVADPTRSFVLITLDPVDGYAQYQVRSR